MSHAHTHTDTCTNMNAPSHIHERIMSQTWIIHATLLNESCHTRELDMFHTRMSHVTHMNASVHTYEWAISHTWMSHITHMNAPSRTHKCITVHTQVNAPRHVEYGDTCTSRIAKLYTYKWRHFTHMNESVGSYEWAISHTWMSHITHMNAPSQIYKCITVHTQVNAPRHVEYGDTCTSRIETLSMNGDTSHIRMTAMSQTSSNPVTQIERHAPLPPHE